MIAVIFEVWPKDGRKQEYLELAALLRKELLKIDGFISIERFQSMADTGKILSLSFWSDENAIKEWRNLEIHRGAQKKGRDSVFTDYRLRVTSIIRDYGMKEREEAPLDSMHAHNNG